MNAKDIIMAILTILMWPIFLYFAPFLLLCWCRNKDYTKQQFDVAVVLSLLMWLTLCIGIGVPVWILL